MRRGVRRPSIVLMLVSIPVTLVAHAPAAHAQDSTSDPASPYSFTLSRYTQATPNAEPATQPSKTTSSVPKGEDYSGDIWSRKYLTGDWGGLRTDLADHGIKFNFRLSQFYQGVASGGANTNFEYGGKLDYILDIDGQKLGLWPGLFVTMHAETLFGHSIDGDAGAFGLPNTSMLYPLPDQHKTAITGLLVEQALSKNFILAAGKINVLDLWAMVYPRMGSGVDGFMNLNMLAPALPWLRYVNLSVMGGGVLVLKDDGQVQGGLLVFDTNNSTTTTGFDAFHDGAAILGLWKFFFDLDEKPGSLLFAFGGSTRRYESLEGTDTTRIPGEGLSNDKKRGAWTGAVVYEQILWHKPDNDKQDLRLFTGFSISDGDPSFSKWNGFASVEATGLLFGREHDRAGVGAFFNNLSSDFKDTVSDLGVLGADLRDMWGTELYYNIEITPWFHLTPSLQVVQNANDDNDLGVMVGVRGVIDF